MFYRKRVTINFSTAVFIVDSYAISCRWRIRCVCNCLCALFNLLHASELIIAVIISSFRGTYVSTKAAWSNFCVAVACLFKCFCKSQYVVLCCSTKTQSCSMLRVSGITINLYNINNNYTEARGDTCKKKDYSHHRYGDT